MSQDQKYFLYNNLRIIITEHFPEKGKQITEIMEDAISKEAKPVLQQTIPILM